MASGVEPFSFRLALGRAFLVAIFLQDPDIALVFARALLTQFPATGPQVP